MMIYSDTPPLDRDEIDRCWMTPAIATNVAGLWDKDKDHRKFFENLSVRGFLPFRRSSAKATAPKLHSLAGALKAGIAWPIVQGGQTFEAGDAVGQAAVELLKQFSIEHAKRSDMPRVAIVYDVWGGKVRTEYVQVSQTIDDTFAFSHPTFSVIDVTYWIDMCLQRYGSVWYENLVARGIIKPSRYRGADVNGYPLDPNHPWNRDLPPEQRAERLKEIEEYLRTLEEQESKSEKPKVKSSQRATKRK